jgi:hypothetical protein
LPDVQRFPHRGTVQAERLADELVDDNPYLREFRRLEPELVGPRDYANLLHGTSRPSAYDRRVWWVRRYSFAIPTDAGFATLARYSPIVELGAGIGYWAFLLRRRRVDRVAYDLAPPHQMPNPNRFRPLIWRPVDTLAVHGDRALYLCLSPAIRCSGAHGI